jgi:hypothetical protein
VRLDRRASAVAFRSGYGMDRSVPPSPEEAQNERNAVAAKTAEAIRVCRSGTDIDFISAGMRGIGFGAQFRRFFLKKQIGLRSIDKRAKTATHESLCALSEDLAGTNGNFPAGCALETLPPHV